MLMGESVEEPSPTEGDDEARPDEAALTLRLRLRWVGYAAVLAGVGVGAAAYGYASEADAAVLTLVVGIVLSLLLGVVTYFVRHRPGALEGPHRRTEP